MSKEPSKPKESDSEHKKKGYQKWNRRGQFETKKKDPRAIPVLRYGPANNFTVFREALANAALKEYGALGKLIKQGDEYKEPVEPDVADYNLEGDDSGLRKTLYLEDLKDYRKEKNKLKENSPKLYGLITQYLSIESLDEIKRQVSYEKVDEEADPQGLWQLVEETHKVTSVSKVEAVVKLAARNEYRNTRQGTYESIITYKDRFKAALKAYTDQKNPDMDEKDIAMDFYNGLDNARYAIFKSETTNLLSSGAIKQPENLNAMYLLANQWVKPKTYAPGLAATFATTKLDQQESSKNTNNKKSGKKSQEKAKPEKEAKRKDISKVECFGCGLTGHYSNQCPYKINKSKKNISDSDDGDEESASGHVTWAEAGEGCSYVTYQVNTVSDVRFKPSEILIDNQANVSIVHPDLARNIEPAKRKVKINGVGGHQFTVEETGFLDPMFQVYVSEHTKANILSFAQVEDQYPITYAPQESFTVHLPRGDIVFKRRDGMYVADWKEYGNIFYSTICTKVQEERAKKAYELARTSGYPSVNELIHLVEDGNIVGMPGITREDVLRAYDLYGVPTAYVRGKMTKKPIGRAVIDESLLMPDKKQKLYSDVMHFGESMFLVTVCDPLNLTISTYIERETGPQLGMALQGQVDKLRSRGFIPTIIYTDPAPGFQVNVDLLPGVIIDVGGAQDNNAKVDIKIRRVKELCRCVKESLPWQIPKTMVKDLVAYAVARSNIKRTTAINQNVCPKVLFTGVKVNFKKELELAFGDYCEVYDGTDNTARSRSVPCIALYPSNNSTGSWEFMNLKTKWRIRRSHWVKMKTTELIINIMNHFDDKVERTPQEVPEPVAEPDPVEEPEPVAPEAQPVEEVTEQGTQESEEVADVIEEQQAEAVSAQEPVSSRTRFRSGESSLRQSKYSMATKVNKRTIVDPVKKKAVEKAEGDEVDLILDGLKAVKIISEEDVEGKAHNCHIFTVDKTLASGEFDKCKSRIVLHGNEQDPELYPDKSSPTVTTHSIFACLAFAAFQGITEVAKIDVKGAFIQTPMEGPPVYIKFSAQLTKLIVKRFPQYTKYVNSKGCLFGKLLKALYGCIQASKLWFNNLVRFLKSEGYEHSPTDPCVMRKIEGKKIFLLLIYVDDILVIASREEMDRLKARFIKEFQWITMEVGATHSYLGMQIKLYEGYTTIDMKYFIEKMLTEVNSEKTFATPATKKIFDVNDAAVVLNEEERKKFHSMVAKILFLSKRARPDILTANSFLCTRVTKATVEDQQKLFRLLGFLRRTKDVVLTLRPQDLKLKAYIDASFAPHQDSKSHTGVTIFLGDALVYAASRKQKCVTKSPTESELVALTDYIGLVELFAEFVAFITNSPVQIPVIYQDSTSVITLVTKGGGIVRTKHLRVRMNLCKEGIDMGRFMIEHVLTHRMIADGCTKALENPFFRFFMNNVLGVVEK